MLLSSDYENILDFSCKIAESCLNFYHDSLRLLSEHFKYTSLAFFPENMNNSSVNGINSGYLTDFFSINLENNFIKEFKEHYYKVSIFQPLNLPKKLLNSPTIKIDDIMPYEMFKQTENFHFLNKYNLQYRLNVILRSANVKLGTLCIFKSKEEGDFTEREQKILEILNNILSSQYKNFLVLSNSQFKQNLLKKCYDNYQDGIIIWNNMHNVLEVTSKAQEYCSEIAESVNTTNDFIYDALCFKNQTNNPIQKTICYLSYNLVQNANSQDLSFISNNYIYTAKTSVIIIPAITGGMETIYFTCITKQQKNETVTVDKLKLFYNLTDREIDIIDLIKKGYSNKEIAAALYLSSNTVKTHITNIFKKIGVNSRTTLLNRIVLIL